MVAGAVGANCGETKLTHCSLRSANLTLSCQSNVVHLAFLNGNSAKNLSSRTGRTPLYPSSVTHVAAGNQSSTFGVIALLYPLEVTVGNHSVSPTITVGVQWWCRIAV